MRLRRTANRRFLLADPRGSVVAVTDGAGDVTDINKYDDYGAPASTNIGRFQFTGQMWLEEAGLYHYKARAYHPALGRFMQTDPIGYGDGMNMYAYVGNDPVNRRDPSGMCGTRLSVESSSAMCMLICNSDCYTDAELARRSDGGGGGGGSLHRTPDGSANPHFLKTPGSHQWRTCISDGICISGDFDGPQSKRDEIVSYALTLLFVAALVTPIPGDELLAGAALVRGGLGVAGRGGRGIGRSSARYRNGSLPGGPDDPYIGARFLLFTGSGAVIGGVRGGACGAVVGASAGAVAGALPPVAWAVAASAATAAAAFVNSVAVSTAFAKVEETIHTIGEQTCNWM